ncbi:hypothetical protein [Sphingopyxis flava]|nr:hypothetical protein [Sphingopyxis flava]
MCLPVLMVVRRSAGSARPSGDMEQLGRHRGAAWNSVFAIIA